MRIDCYGREKTEGGRAQLSHPAPLETRTADGVTYARFAGGDAECAVHRIAVGADGVVLEEWAWGSWEDAEALSYRPLDEDAEVTA